jgi:hypothetical protein
MRRKLLLGGAALGLAFLLAPVVAGAINSPPLPSTTYFGAASGALPGQSIIALITVDTTATVCGLGDILATPSPGTVYRIDVVPDGTRAGCGAPGRQIQFYVVSGAGGTAPGRLATNLAPWSTASAVQQDLTFGPPLGQQRQLPESASDGTY